jgi:hypothetical protein
MTIAITDELNELAELVDTDDVLTNPDIVYSQVVDDSGKPHYMNRILIGTAVTGLLRVEWVGARYGATVPVNWSQVVMTAPIPTYMPMRYLVADAQNLIVKEALYPRGRPDKGGAFQWLLLLEHDVIIPPDAFLILNEYLQEAIAPIVSGLYYTRSEPSVPLIFKGRGSGFYGDWEQGDIVYCDGVPTGILLIHTDILQLMWDESPEYVIPQTNTVVRRVFDTPRELWAEPEQAGYLLTKAGTSDLAWCDRVIEGDYIRRAGWDKYMDELDDPTMPMICDTRLFCQHMNIDGSSYP